MIEIKAHGFSDSLQSHMMMTFDIMCEASMRLTL